jgi:hypothetical protein
MYTLIMAIANLDQYIAASKQRVVINKLATRTSVAVVDFSLFDLAGNPGAGVLAGTSTASGVVPTDATAGCPIINFSTGVGYLSKVEFASTAVGRLKLFDMLFKAGAYAFTAGTTTLSAQPVISQRCPDYPGSGVVFGNGNEIWIEVSTAFVTGTAWQVQVTYTNQAGTAGRTSIISAAQAAAGLTLGKMFMLALQAGDSGVQKIESVIVTNGGTAMTAGNFNVLIMRPLWTNGRVQVVGGGDIHDMLRTGMPIVYTDSALVLVAAPDSTSTGFPEIVLEIANG